MNITKKTTILFFSIVLMFSFALTASAANSITNRLKGRLLLQVQRGGAIWYVNPTDSQKYSVTFANALNLFQSFALGITNADLLKIPADINSIDPYLDTDNDGYPDKTELQNGYSPYIPGSNKGRFKTDNNLATRLKGRLLLQVEQGGAIWYVDVNGLRHNVRWNNLMDLFTRLALGITDKDLETLGTNKTSNLCKNINQVCQSYSQGVGGGDSCCSGLGCDGIGPDGTTGICKDNTNTSTWQTYADNEYGFEIKNPKDLIVSQADSNTVTIGSQVMPYIVIERYSSRQNIDLQSFIQERLAEHDGILDASKIKWTEWAHKEIFNQYVIDAEFENVAGGYTGNVIWTYFTKGDWVYKIAALQGYGNMDQKAFQNQILSTFKFLD